MSMTDKERILAFLSSLSPKSAAISVIQEGAGIEGRYEVYRIAKELLKEGEIHGVKGDRGWSFWIGEPDTFPEPVPTPRRRRRGLGPRRFEALAREIMGEHFQAKLEKGYVGQVHKEFDFVAPYQRVVGDALYFRRPRGTRWAPAKAGIIAERVWMLEKTGAPNTFLVFGNDRNLPEMWLERYGNLVYGVKFYFLSDDGELEELAMPPAGGVAVPKVEGHEEEQEEK
jgi:hypothetical protein